MATTQVNPAKGKKPLIAGKIAGNGKGPQIAVPPKEDGKSKSKFQVPAIIPTVSKGALSVEVGPRVIAGLAKANVDEAQAKSMLDNVKRKRFDLLADVTMAIIKAAKADDTINIATSFGEDKVAQNKLNDQLGIALGFREVVTVGKGENAKQRVTYAKAVQSFFPMAGEDKDSDEYKRKSTLRSNFLTLLKKCTQSAVSIIDKKMDAKVDKTSGTLLLSGPAVKKAFGAPSVLLNEKQSVTNDKGKEVKLTERPTFTAIAAMAASDHGGHVRRGSNTRGTTIATPTAAIAAICASLVSAIEKITGAPNDKQKAALESVRSAIEKAID